MIKSLSQRTQRTIPAIASCTTLVMVAAFSSTAQAHVGGMDAHTHDALSSFMSGASHPVGGLDHLAAMLSVGLWTALGAGHTGRTEGVASTSQLWTAPLAFAVTLLLGALLAMSGMQLPGVEPMIAASVLVLGLLVAGRARLSIGAGAWLVAAFALFHGLAHGQELGGHALAALTGMVLSTMALHACGIALGLALQKRSHWWSRLAGAGLAGLGVSLLSPVLTGAL
ncbi:MAG TPA: HupE/UreJ family protein [Aquabacterium sp.]|nr:HupE/UreJ family protein [Aquabacterium sp.]HRH28907.1 HupE/UreJ family protein [Aquabacterium sp.]